MAQHAHRQSLQSLGVSLRNVNRLLASLHSVQQTHIQNTVLVAMDLTQLETYILDEWVFVPIMIVAMLNSFGIGLVIGFIWVCL
jgi:hypothetical protein